MSWKAYRFSKTYPAISDSAFIGIIISSFCQAQEKNYKLLRYTHSSSEWIVQPVSLWFLLLDKPSLNIRGHLLIFYIEKKKQPHTQLSNCTSWHRSMIAVLAWPRSYPVRMYSIICCLTVLYGLLHIMCWSYSQSKVSQEYSNIWPKEARADYKPVFHSIKWLTVRLRDCFHNSSTPLPFIFCSHSLKTQTT